MEITLAGQTTCFLYSCLFGACMSLLYDFFRALRVILHFGKIATFFEDIFYFFTLGVVTFGFVIVVNDGELRGYIFLGAFLGWIFTIFRLEILTIRALCWMMEMIRRFFHMIWRRIFVPMLRPMKKDDAKAEAQRQKRTKKDRKNICKNEKSSCKIRNKYCIIIYIHLYGGMRLEV